MSNQTPTRTIRVSDELWNAAKEKAAELGVTVTDIVIQALEELVES
jgi:predicted HicB family RNase H-like nuclease